MIVFKETQLTEALKVPAVRLKGLHLTKCKKAVYADKHVNAWYEDVLIYSNSGDISLVSKGKQLFLLIEPGIQTVEYSEVRNEKKVKIFLKNGSYLEFDVEKELVP